MKEENRQDLFDTGVDEIYPRVLLVGVDTGEEQDFAHSMEELKSLAEAANKQVVGIITQKLDMINKALYIGTGKVIEVKEFAADCQAEEVIFDNALSPSQIRNLGNELELQISNDRISFLQDGAEVAYFSNRKLYVTDAQILHSLQLGNFAYMPRPNGNLSFKHT